MARFLVVVLLAVSSEHATGTALRRMSNDEMVPVGQSVGDNSIEETVRQTGDLGPQSVAASQMISPAEEEEAEEGDAAEEIPASPPAEAFSQMQRPVNDAGDPVPVVAPADNIAGGEPARTPATQLPIAPQAPLTPALPVVIPDNTQPVSEAAVVTDDAQPVSAVPLAPATPVIDATPESEDIPSAAQDAAADGALPVADGDPDVVDDSSGVAEAAVASTSTRNRNPSRPALPHAPTGSSRADLSLALQGQKAHQVHAKHREEPTEGDEEESESEEEGGGEEGEDGESTPSNASQTVLDPNVKEYTICDPPCITGRGICNDQVCFCKGAYYGSTCQHKMREDEWLQFAPPVVGVLCLVACAGGIALAQTVFNVIQSTRKMVQEHLFGPPTVKKECWQPSDSSASKKGKK